MTVHLIKLCVGAVSVDQFEIDCARRLERQRQAGLPQRLVHKTRRAPRRADAVLDGGSLYWVIKGAISVRQAVTALELDADDDGRACCAIHLDRALVRTEAFPFRPFQGWRYLDLAKAPPDLASDLSDRLTVPSAMAAELRALGLL